MQVEEILQRENLTEYDCYLLEDEVLTVIFHQDIIQYNTANGSIINRFTMEIQDYAFGLYSVPSGYIVHGELEIGMYDKEFHLIWRFSGRDIFAAGTDKHVFKMLEDRICLYDFDDNYYEIDYNGKLLLDRPVKQ